MMPYAVDLDLIRAASARIAPYAHRTPVITCRTIDRLAGRALHFKCENLQRVGAFKFRGAMNAVAQLDDAVAARGVVTHSSGNHAQALALAARTRGIAAHIVMPTSAPAIKRRAVEEYGARVHPCEPTLVARERGAGRVLDETGGTLVHPYDQPEIIAGQGTCVVELLEDVPDLDAVVAPIGGGGLMSGTCIAGRGLRENLRLFAAEPAGADDAFRSMAAGRLIPQTGPSTVADGLLTSLGRLTWPIVRDHVERVILVDDRQILDAVRMVHERMKLVIEPSAAVALAAVLTPEFRGLEGIERVGILLSGGNVEWSGLPRAPH